MKLILHDVMRKLPIENFSTTVPVVIDKNIKCPEGDKTYDMPFKSMSFEMSDRRPLMKCSDGEGMGVFLYHITELSPTSYELIVMVTFPSGKVEFCKMIGGKGFYYDSTKKKWIDDGFGESENVYEAFLQDRHYYLGAMYDRMNERGCIKARTTMCGKGKNRKPTKPRDYIIIAPKSDSKTKTRSTYNYTPCSWDHSWRVSGHWRRLPEGTKVMGKDREGNRTVDGLTWIPEHIKGDGPEIIKTRLVI